MWLIYKSTMTPDMTPVMHQICTIKKLHTVEVLSCCIVFLSYSYDIPIMFKYHVRIRSMCMAGGSCPCKKLCPCNYIPPDHVLFKHTNSWRLALAELANLIFENNNFMADGFLTASVFDPMYVPNIDRSEISHGMRQLKFQDHRTAHTTCHQLLITITFD